MQEQVLQAARELGIESKVHIVDDHRFPPTIRVIEGTRIVQSRIDLRWFLDPELRDLKTILSDLYRMVSKN
jgi:hypothetical protein